jgi:hypothetical protein
LVLLFLLVAVLIFASKHSGADTRKADAPAIIFTANGLTNDDRNNFYDLGFYGEMFDSVVATVTDNARFASFLGRLGQNTTSARTLKLPARGGPRRPASVQSLEAAKRALFACTQPSLPEKTHIIAITNWT